MAVAGAPGGGGGGEACRRAGWIAGLRKKPLTVQPSHWGFIL